MSKLLLGIVAVLVMSILIMLSGCSGTVSASVGGGGSFHPGVKSQDYAQTLKQSPSMGTTATRSYPDTRETLLEGK